MRNARRCLLVLGLASLASACSLRRLAVNSLADSLAGSAVTFAREDDPELARAALPFAMKTIEGVLIGDPENETLLAAASGAFGLYAYAFVQVDAERIEAVDYARGTAMKARALGLYLRARDYALRGLELRHAGIGAALRTDPVAAAALLGEADVELAYWAGGTWGLAISLAKDDPALVADVDAVRALLRRALELDEDYGEGALHEALIPIEGLSRLMGGSEERAREHYRRALELSGGRRASVHLKVAENLSIPAQDRAEFERMLALVMAVDLDAAPDQRLSNRISRIRARDLLDRIDDLFLPPLE
ncbi:MAG TPA: TRAP transporter TatT component family protein [Planctomycetota bacterium]